MKTLRVGDPHITVRNLDEAERLLSFIYEMAVLHDVSNIEFLGDLMHTHAVLRVEVVDFWTRHLTKMGQVFTVLVLVGNHDQPGSREKEQQMNGLNIFNSIKGVQVINRPMCFNKIAYIPYMSDKEAFVSSAKEMYDNGATEILVAHQNFTVSLYSDLIDPALIPQKAIITGHIHEQKQVGKVFQVGTPKWDTLTDANEPKGIWIYKHNIQGVADDKQFISTAHVVTPINKVTLNEGETEVTLDPNAKNYLELVGSSAWILQKKKEYKGLAQIKARPSDRKSININKDKAFTMVDYLNTTFKPIDGVEKAEIQAYLQEVMNG